ncbi:hypothetical protein, partial [Alicyclobacillus cellulosilyticus]
YIPASHVPKDQLKAYLECTKELSDYIDSIYEREERASARYGLNLSYFFDRVSHHLSIYSSSNLDLEIEDLLNIIQEK